MQHTPSRVKPESRNAGDNEPNPPSVGAEARVRQNLSRLAAANAIGIFSAARGVLRDANDACLAILGYTKADLDAGRLTLELLISPRLGDNATNQREPAARPGGDFETEYVQPSGRKIPILVALAQLGADQHTGLILDLTSQRSRGATAQQSEARYRAAAEGFDAFVIFDAIRDEHGSIVDFRYVDLNSHAVQRVGRSTREELIGKRLTEVVPSAAVRPYIEMYAHVVTTQRAIEEESHVLVPGIAPRWVAVHVVPLGDGVAVTSRDVSKAHADEEERKRLVAFLDLVVDNVPAAVFVKDAATLRFEIFNRAGEERFGIARGAVIGKRNADVFPKETAELFEASDREVLSTGNPFILEQRVDSPGGTHWYQSKKVLVRDERGVPKHILGVSVDVTAIKRAEESLKGFEVLFRRSPLGVILSSVEGMILDANDAASRLLGFEREEMIGRASDQIGLLSSEARARIFELLRANGFVRDLVVRVQAKSGEYRDAMISVERIEVDEQVRYITTFLDITPLKRAEEALRAASLIDELTGLPNRRGLFTMGEQLLRMAKRPGGPCVVLLFIDLDGLKRVNDVYGHSAGDDLLREAATFLRETFRESDIVARLGGDEFVVLAASEASGASTVVKRLTDRLRTHNEARAAAPALEMSVGLSTFASDKTLQQVVEEADRKMYEAKRRR